MTQALYAHVNNKKKWLSFCQDNCQKVLVLHVNPQIYQDNKSLLKQRDKRQLSTGSAAALI
jgi:ribosomal protein L24E